MSESIANLDLAIQEFSQVSVMNHKRLRTSTSLPLNLPRCNNENLAEITRLAERKLPIVKEVGYPDCVICYSKKHALHSCPCRAKIPSKIKHIGPEYDRVCLGCGKIGLACCSVGSYAVRKRCSFCYKFGHWFWEERCPENYPLKISTYWLWKCFKEGKPIQERRLQVPLYTTDESFEQLLRLTQRTTCAAAPVPEGCCGLCYAKGHPYYHCEYFNSIPDGVVLGPDFDEFCAGCGKIGQRCCGAGAYPIDKWCRFCKSHGHWYWDDNHNYDAICDPDRCQELAQNLKTYLLLNTLKRKICPGIMKLTT